MRTRSMKSAVVRYDHFTTPPSISRESINEATLPAKIETARRAIAQCTDLPELLMYKSQAEGLAACVRVMKHIGPEMIRNANCLVADAWMKAGELLKQYSNVAENLGYQRGRSLSDRITHAAELGLTKSQANNLVRIAAAPRPFVHELIQQSSSLRKIAEQTPVVYSGVGKTRHSDALSLILRGPAMNCGLNIVVTALKKIELSKFHELIPDERKIVKAKITEAMELLDEMDRLCR